VIIQTDKFSRREWLLAVVVLQMFQYWVFSVSHELKSYQDVLNYVSFAATITSLILAVIAIIYGFVQSETQHKTSAALSAQVDTLRTASTELNSSKDRLEQQLDRVTLVTTKIDLLHDLMGSNFKSLEQSLTTIRDEVKQQAATAKPPQAVAPTSKSALSKAEIADRILAKTTYDADLMTLALHEFSQANLQLEHIEFLSVHFAKPLAGVTEFSTYLRAGLQMLTTLSAFGLVHIGKGKPLLLDSDLKLWLADQIIRITSSDNGILEEGVPKIKASFQTPSPPTQSPAPG
jgi:hypothetical protein